MTRANAPQCSPQQSSKPSVKKQRFKRPGPYTTGVIHKNWGGRIHKNGNLTRSWQGGLVGLPQREPANIGNLCRYWQARRGCFHGSNCKWVHDMSIEHEQRKLYVDRKPQRKQGFATRTQLRTPKQRQRRWCKIPNLPQTESDSERKSERIWKLKDDQKESEKDLKSNCWCTWPVRGHTDLLLFGFRIVVARGGSARGTARGPTFQYACIEFLAVDCGLIALQPLLNC